MQSQSRLAPIVGRNGIQGARTGRRPESETATVEIDSTLARVLGISDGLKVGQRDQLSHKALADISQISVVLHVDPPLAHTVNIEPMTPTDWDSMPVRSLSITLSH